MNTFKRLRSLCRVLKANKLWRVDREAIRTRAQLDNEQEEDFCPLTFAHYVATGDVWPTIRWASAGRTFGFEHDESREIVAAADCTHGDKHRLKKLRRILEKACGIICHGNHAAAGKERNE